MAELSNLPEDIMVEVLSRLPPKSLMRFKCVRKSWRRLISNSDFAAKHLSASKHNKHITSSTTIVIRRVPNDVSDKKGVKISLFDLCQRLDGEDHEFHPVQEDLYSPLYGSFDKTLCNWLRSCVRISAHCDGILCLTDRLEYIVLCNPAIKEFKCVPVPSPKSQSCSDVGFGYDLKSKDYKIVQIVMKRPEEHREGVRRRVIDHHPTAHIYSLRTSSWKEIKVIDNLVTENTIYWPHLHSIYRNGIIYWCGQGKLRQENYIITSDYSEEDEDDLSELKHCIVSFDIGNEVFQVILAPDDCYLMYCAFGLWNESIAFCTGRPWSHHLSTSLEIWVLDDLGGGEGRWTKYLSFKPVVSDFYRHMGLFCYNDQLVTVFSSQSAVIFQEVFTNKFKRLPLNTELRDYTTFSQAVECTRSIVSIK